MKKKKKKTKKEKNEKKEKKEKNEENEDDEIPEEGTLIKKIVYTVLPGNYVQQEVFNGTEKEPSEVKVLKNKKEYEPYITDDILNVGTKCTITEYNDGKGTIVTKTKTHFINKDKEEGEKVETKIISVKNTVDYHIPNEDKIPYHEK
jgi:hypothetical protein